MKNSVTTLQSKVVIVGKGSRLAMELMAGLRHRNVPFEVVSLKELATQTRAQRGKMWQSIPPSATVIWVGANTDFGAPREELMKINFQLPVETANQLMEASEDIRFITFGSVFEKHPGTNEYLASKLELAKWLGERRHGRFLHIRTHTLVGKVSPPAHMLLGQLTYAIRQSTPFYLGSPHSTRQYLDQKDFSEWVLSNFHDLGNTYSGSLQVGGAEKVRLHDLVSSLILKFNPSVDLVLDEKYSWESRAPFEIGVDDFVLANKCSIANVENYFGGWLREEPSDS